MLKQLHEGSRIQQKRFSKVGFTDRLAQKILEGNRNSMRTFNIRLFVLKFQNKDLWNELVIVKELMEAFADAVAVRDVSKIKKIISKYELEKKELALLVKKQQLRDASYTTLALIILTATILLFKEAKDVAFDENIFSGENRYNPLNPFFPLKF